MSFEEMLLNAGGFKGLFELVRRNGQDLEDEVEQFLKRESGLFSLAGFSVVKLASGYSELKFETSQTVVRRGGMIHGGVISYALDTAGGLAVMSENTGTDQVTLELKINFLEPALKSPFRVIGRTVRQGRTVSVAESEVRDSEGKLCAKSLGTWYQIHKK
jgi:uncharacterized protein (TIGR00369 family)